VIETQFAHGVLIGATIAALSTSSVYILSYYCYRKALVRAANSLSKVEILSSWYVAIPVSNTTDGVISIDIDTIGAHFRKEARDEYGVDYLSDEDIDGIVEARLGSVVNRNTEGGV